jgi:magnesium chelatase subunit I
MHKARTVGELKEGGYRSRSVKQELRENTIARIRDSKALFPGIIGFDDTVIPQIANALLSRHDILLLGLRGQAKTRIIRALPQLLDEYIPTIAGFELPDDPLNPQFKQSRMIVAEQGDETELHWIHRDQRFNEKLATPDVTIADLIGEIDIVKHAEGRHLSDESILHFGLIPRTNRGIFAINEIPDLPPRIQVGLFNVLEERDVQIRAFPIRLSLDLCVVFSANPEDYTNRGRIVTPLKDRIGSVIRTHYPRRIEEAIQITADNAWLKRDSDIPIDVPSYMFEIIEEAMRLARESAHVNQQSGVSVRASIAGTESMVSNAERRAVLLSEPRVVPRPSDLPSVAAGCRGKLELMLADDEKAEDKLIIAILGEATKSVFANHSDGDVLEDLVDQFADGGVSIEVGDDVRSSDLVRAALAINGLTEAAAKICEHCNRPGDDEGNLASAIEFVLEGLFVHDRLTKYSYHARSFYKR